MIEIVIDLRPPAKSRLGARPAARRIFRRPGSKADAKNPRADGQTRARTTGRAGRAAGRTAGRGRTQGEKGERGWTNGGAGGQAGTGRKCGRKSGRQNEHRADERPEPRPELAKAASRRANGSCCPYVHIFSRQALRLPSTIFFCEIAKKLLEDAHHHVGRVTFAKFLNLVVNPCGCIAADVVRSRRSQPPQNRSRVLSFESGGHALSEI